MLHLLFGPSGSGKTYALTEDIRHDIENGRHCILLVPEQQAYISERNLPPLLPENAGLFFRIRNFSGLAEDVFSKFGGVTQTTSEPALRTLLMWDSLRSLSGVLSRYAKEASPDAGLSLEMLRTVEDLRNNGLRAAELENAAERLSEGHPLKEKLSDLAAIMATYDCRVEASLGASPDKLMRLADLLAEQDCFADTQIYVDSFSSFTAPEYAVLRALLSKGRDVTVALCADEYASRKIHFQGAFETAKRLKQLANDCGVTVQTDTLEARAEGKPEALNLLERDLWNFYVTKEGRTILPDRGRANVHLLTCPNLYEEAEAVALQIRGLVRDGMHYGDIAVIARDTETYRGVLDAALERHHIPFFLSERTDLSTKPLARLVLSALLAVSKNYRVQDLLTLLKTGLCGVEARDVSLFEEYCETWHLTGSAFADGDWNMNPDGLTTDWSERGREILESANRVRAAVMNPLFKLAANLKQSKLVPDRCRAVYEYLGDLNISAQLGQRAERELALGQKREAGETLRLYELLTEMLTKLCNLFPKESLSLDDFLVALGILFGNTDLGSVPGYLDCVMVGSASTLRVENIRVSFLLGLCEGEFPQAVTDGGILTESDKLALCDLGFRMNTSAQSKSAEELFYAYRALTKPTEQVFLSSPLMQPDGSLRAPSTVMTRVCFLLDRKPAFFDSSNLKEKEETKAETAIESGIPAPKGTKLFLSQTSIQTFVLCPYRYYCTYRLKLRERKDSAPSYSDDGTFLHEIFRHFLEDSIGPDGKLRLPPNEEIASIADRIISDYLANVCPMPPEEMDASLLHLFARLRDLSLTMLREIVCEIQSGKFIPTYFEKVINGIPALTLPLSDGSSVSLCGKIDRVDLYRANGKTYVRVVDYKSSEHKFSIEDLKSGMDVQLLLYLFAMASDIPDGTPAGAQFLYAKKEDGVITVDRSGFLLSDDEISSAADTSENARFTKKLLRQGAEEIQALTDEMLQTIESISLRILSGDARKTPSEDACRFCPLKDACDRAERGFH